MLSVTGESRDDVTGVSEHPGRTLSYSRARILSVLLPLLMRGVQTAHCWIRRRTWIRNSLKIHSEFHATGEVACADWGYVSLTVESCITVTEWL